LECWHGCCLPSHERSGATVRIADGYVLLANACIEVARAVPPWNGVQCNYLSGVFDVATAQDCSIAQSEAPAAAPGVLNDYVVEFVDDIRSARAAGAADVGRSNGRGTVEGASARDRLMVDDG